MQKFTFHRESTGLFSEQQNRLVYRQDELLNFVNLPYRLENFEKQISFKEASYPAEQRTILNNVLESQYKNLEISKSVDDNLKLLHQNNTFTVTTGHQLSLFTGPLYFIYKIIHTIKLAESLNREYEDSHFVPVFWLASEDHDFEEIKNVELFGKTITWQTDQKGPVGKFELDGFDLLKKEFASFFNGDSLTEIEELLSSYDGSNLSEATFHFVNKLFGKYGLIIIDGDNRLLKRSFIPVLLKEISDEFSYKAVEKTNIQLEKEGLKIQVHAREINLFFMEDGMRERILHVENGFFIEGKGKLTAEELIEIIELTPEKFSPNVVLRPLYQEWVFPNLCYIGGVGEIAYWLQLKDVFSVFKIPYPIIAVRNSILWIDPVISKKIAKTDLALEDIFLETEHLKKQYVLKNEEDEIEMKSIYEHFDLMKEELIEKVLSIDPGLEKFAIGETVRMEKQIESIKEKLYRSLKSRHEQSLMSIDQVKHKLFPNNGLQERTVNLFTISAGTKVENRIENLYHFQDPFEPDLIVIRE